MAMTTDRVLDKMTVNLIEKASRARDESAAREGVSRTDVVNRALQLYNYLGREVANGAKVYITRSDGATAELTMFL